MKYYLFFLTMCLGLVLNAQTYRFTPFPTELYFGAGPVIYQGDLPSTSLIMAPAQAKFDFQELNIALTIGVGHRLHKRWAIRNNISYVSFAGNDAYDENKKIRNLSFRTKMFEYTPLVEYSLVHWDIKANNRYHHLYLGTGISLFYFNPQAKYNGKYYNLQPLSTEGQSLTGRALPYSRISVALPFVTGYRYRISKQCVIGVELSLRKSFTDYLDDVSTNYYDNNVIKVNKGEVAAQLADRNLSGKPYSAESNRGNPDKGDNYFYTLFQLSYFFRS